MIVITGASGQLGRLVIQSLLTKVPASRIVAAVRNPEKISDLAALGVQVRRADYTDSSSLDAAFQGAEKVLLISSSEVGQRLVYGELSGQHSAGAATRHLHPQRQGRTHCHRRIGRPTTPLAISMRVAVA